MGADVLIGIGYMLRTQGWRNYTLFIMLTNMFFYAVVNDVLFFFYARDITRAPWALIFALITGTELMIHWLITQSYIKVAYETKFILDRDVLFNDPVKLAAVRRFKRIMKCANVAMTLLILAIAVCFYVANKTGNLLLNYIANICWLVLPSFFTIMWAWPLYKLYRDTRNSKKLLPNKKIFILHGSLLVLFLLL